MRAAAVQYFLAGAMLALPAAAQSALEPPLAGVARDATGVVRPLFGVAGNFLPGDPHATGACAAAFSGRLELIVEDGTVRALDAQGVEISRHDVPGACDDAPLIAFEAGGDQALLAWPKAGALDRWRDATLEPLTLDPAALAGDVVSLAAAGDRVRWVVRREDGLWEVETAASDGSIQSAAALVGAREPAWLASDGLLVYTGDRAIVLRRPDQSELRLPFADAPVSFTPMGRDWVQIRTAVSGRNFALRLTEGRERIYRLPEVAQ